MDELIALLREIEASDDLIALAEQFGHRNDDNAQPLNDDQLVELLDGLIALGADETVSNELIGMAADAATEIRAERTALAERAEQEEAERQERLARLRGDEDPSASDDDDEDSSVEPEDAADDENDGEADEPVATEADAAADTQPEPVAAAAAPARRPPARRSLRRRTPADAQPVEREPSTGFSIRFEHGVPGVEPGQATTSLDDLNKAMIAKAKSFGRSRANGEEKVLVATVHRDMDDDRKLTDDLGRPLASHVMSEKVDRVISKAVAAARRGGPKALTAAGGLCAPLAPIYSVETLGEGGRPVRDSALVSFGSSRGGVVSTTPPTIGEATSAVGAWTVTNDVDAADGTPPEKPFMRVECNTPRETEIEALPRGLVFGNLLARTHPEYLEAVSETVMVAQDRFAEARHIAQMRALSTVTNAEARQSSAVRDILDVLSRAAWGIRSRHRLSRDFPFRVVLPEIMWGVVQTDVARQMPTGSADDTLAYAEAQLARAFAERNLNVTWSPDMNIQAAQTAGSDLHEWPGDFEFVVYPEGTFIHLDAGELDLGIYRDHELVKVNDAAMFAETFENVHMVGVESIAGTIIVCPNGSVSGTTDPADLCGANS